MGLSKRYKIRRYKIQDKETAVLIRFLEISCISYLVSLYLTVKLQFVYHQTSNSAYFSTSSEKMELAQANHSRLNAYSSFASMLSCMK